MRSILIYISPLVLLSACSAQNGISSLPIKSKVKIELDSIRIEQNELDKIDNFRFACYTANYKVNPDSTLSLIYLINNSYIVDFNLTSKDVGRIKITGENPVNSSFLSLTKGNSFYTLLNESSKLFVYYSDSLKNTMTILDSLPSFKKNKNSVSSEMGFGYRLPENKDSSILIVLISNSDKGNNFAKINLITKDTEFFRFKYSNELVKYYRHPLRNGIKMEIVGDTLLVNYQFSEKIDLFSLKTGKFLGQKIVKSMFQEKPIPYLTTDRNEFENERYSIEADYYDGLTYNPYKKCFYRLYYHTLPRKNNKDVYTISKDKVLSIAIFDHNFNWIGEQIVDEKNYFAGVVPHPDGALGLWGGRSGEDYFLKIVKHD